MTSIVQQYSGIAFDFCSTGDLLAALTLLSVLTERTEMKFLLLLVGLVAALLTLRNFAKRRA